MTGKSAETSASAPVFDRRSALERLGGDEQLFRELATYFLEDSAAELAKIDDGLAADDWETVRIAAHTLKGLAANFSAKPATEAARELEQAAFDADAGRATPLVGPLRAEVERLCRSLVGFAG